MKKPSLSSAAAVARAVSRLLRAAGFTMSVKGKYRWTEGYWTSRVGYSSRVAVNYHSRFLRYDDEERAWVQLHLDLAWDFLREKGYPVDERGRIECEHPE